MGPKEREIKRRLRVLEHAEKIGNVRMTCRYFGLSRSTFYRWKTKYDKQGESGLAGRALQTVDFKKFATVQGLPGSVSDPSLIRKIIAHVRSTLAGLERSLSSDRRVLF